SSLALVPDCVTAGGHVIWANALLLARSSTTPRTTFAIEAMTPSRLRSSFPQNGAAGRREKRPDVPDFARFHGSLAALPDRSGRDYNFRAPAHRRSGIRAGNLHPP